MASMNMLIHRRRATVDANKWMAPFNKIEEGIQPCHVLGLYQVTNEDESNPYFICELNSGQCIYADPTKVTFVDTDENGELIE